MFTVFVHEEDKEDGAHTPDPAGGAALHASLADEATLALKGKVAHALLVQAIEQNKDGLGWTSDPMTQFAGVNAARGPSDKPYPEQDPDWSELWDATNFVAPSLPAVYAAVSQANGIKVPANVREMLQSPDFHGKGGWHEAVEREIAIVDKNIEVVSYAEYKRRKARYGNLVSLGHAVVAIVQKQDASGKCTKKRIRITYAAQRRTGDGTDKLTFWSGCAEAASNKVTTQVGLDNDMEQSSDDVSSAYYKGKPIPAE